MEIRTKTLIFQTKHRMDFAPLGTDSRWVVLGQPEQPSPLATVPNEPVIVSRGRLILGYSDLELVTRGSGYQFIHAADMMYCAEIHLRSEFSCQSHTFHTLLNPESCFTSALSDKDGRQRLHFLQAADQSGTLVVGSSLRQGGV